MSRGDVIRMAREAAAIHGHTFRDVPQPETIEFLEAFHSLVAAHEREECAKVADRHSTCENDTPNVLAVAIRARGTQ
jgi:hypothetical protein